jgi:hypothetical protein
MNGELEVRSEELGVSNWSDFSRHFENLSPNPSPCRRGEIFFPLSFEERGLGG